MTGILAVNARDRGRQSNGVVCRYTLALVLLFCTSVGFASEACNGEELLIDFESDIPGYVTPITPAPWIRTDSFAAAGDFSFRSAESNHRSGFRLHLPSGSAHRLQFNYLVQTSNGFGGLSVSRLGQLGDTFGAWGDIDFTAPADIPISFSFAGNGLVAIDNLRICALIPSSASVPFAWTERELGDFPTLDSRLAETQNGVQLIRVLGGEFLESARWTGDEFVRTAVRNPPGTLQAHVQLLEHSNDPSIVAAKYSGNTAILDSSTLKFVDGVHFLQTEALAVGDFNGDGSTETVFRNLDTDSPVLGMMDYESGRLHWMVDVEFGTRAYGPILFDDFLGDHAGKELFVRVMGDRGAILSPSSGDILVEMPPASITAASVPSDDGYKNLLFQQPESEFRLVNPRSGGTVLEFSSTQNPAAVKVVGTNAYLFRSADESTIVDLQSGNTAPIGITLPIGVRDAFVTNLNADGVLDFVVETYLSMHVFDGASGSEIWNSQGAELHPSAHMVVGLVDDDFAPDILSLRRPYEDGGELFLDLRSIEDLSIRASMSLNLSLLGRYTHEKLIYAQLDDDEATEFGALLSGHYDSIWWEGEWSGSVSQPVVVPATNGSTTHVDRRGIYSAGRTVRRYSRQTGALEEESVELGNFVSTLIVGQADDDAEQEIIATYEDQVVGMDADTLEIVASKEFPDFASLYAYSGWLFVGYDRSVSLHRSLSGESVGELTTTIRPDHMVVVTVGDVEFLIIVQRNDFLMEVIRLHDGVAVVQTTYPGQAGNLAAIGTAYGAVLLHGSFRGLFKGELMRPNLPGAGTLFSSGFDALPVYSASDW